MAVVHFDAHLDTWDTYFGAPYTHGTPFRRASEEGLLDRSACLHVGIRGPLYAGSDLADETGLGFQVVGSVEMDDLGVRGVVERIRDRVGDRPVYVCVDIDVLDPAFAPGTGTPEAGGLSRRELLAILRGLRGARPRGRRRGRGGAGVRPRRDHRDRRRARGLRAGLGARAAVRPAPAVTRPGPPGQMLRQSGPASSWPWAAIRLSPPSTVNEEPVTYAERGEARKPITDATSTTWPGRPSGLPGRSWW